IDLALGKVFCSLLRDVEHQRFDTGIFFVDIARAAAKVNLDGDHLVGSNTALDGLNAISSRKIGGRISALGRRGRLRRGWKDRKAEDKKQKEDADCLPS